MKTIIATAVLALCAAGCSASFKAGSTSDTSAPDGKPISSDDDDMGKPTADNDEFRSSEAEKSDDSPKSELAAASSTSTSTSTSAIKDGDCVPGKAKGHTKDKAQGEAKGHDKPPCPDEPGKDAAPAKEPSKDDAKAKAKAGDKPADKASAKADPLKTK